MRLPGGPEDQHFEYGGLLAPSVPPVGGTLTLDLGGPPAAVYAAYLGFEGAALSLGAGGTLFLDPAAVVLLAAGQLPPSGAATILSVPAPASLAGTAVPVQAGTLDLAGTGALLLTNLEELGALA